MKSSETHYNKKTCWLNRGSIRCNRIVAQFVLSKKRSEDYEELFKCFLSRYLDFSIPEKSLAFYPGASSSQGKLGDGIEGFYRILPVISSWIHSGRPQTVILPGHGLINLRNIMRDGITNAITPSSPGYYGEIHDYDSKIIAASVIALSLWHVKHMLPSLFSRSQMLDIANWLNGVNNKEIVDNNWHLFVVMTNAVLKHFGLPYNEANYRAHYYRHKSFYRGNGWYSDGPQSILNYYNAWEVYPYLIWIDQIDSSLDRTFIRNTTKEFIENFIYFFSSYGFPIFGRSICYRMALPTPLILADTFGWSPLKTGQSRAAFNATWAYFLKNGAVRNGLITQGYCGKNLDFLDSYSGPASCNWLLMSIAAALFNSPNSTFWNENPTSLPIEIDSYDIFMSDIDMRIAGEKLSGDICVYIRSISRYPNTEREHFSLVAEMLDKLLTATKIKETQFWALLPYRMKKWLNRPENDRMKYGLGRYSSRNPFCGCR